MIFFNYQDLILFKFNSESLSLPNHRPLSSSVMSDAIEMTYLDLSKRRQQQQQQQMSVSNTTETDAVPKITSIDESQQQQLTTQSSFSDISDLPTIKDNNKTKTSRKVSTTTNDTNRNIVNLISIIYFVFKGIELSTHTSTSPDLQIPFYCGNHLVDITRGILHLYKDK
jgi:hypothetical protein